jgi:hypothetical protein
MLFGVPREQDKDATGSVGVAEDGILNVALRDLAKDLGDETVPSTPASTSSPTMATAGCWTRPAASTMTQPTPATWNLRWRRQIQAHTSSGPAA